MKRFSPYFFICFIFFLLVLSSAPPQRVFAKTDWISVRSKNFTLIGDAGEKDIRRAGARLEQFRESIKQIFPKTNLDKPIPTTVYVFSSHSAFRQFKPRRNGQIVDSVAGFFVEGRENVLIALTEEQRTANPYEVIFHEYQHYVLDNNFDDPPLWLNEGLAEFYSQFKVEEQKQKVIIGAPIARHVYTLRERNMIPLRTLFGVNHRSKEYTETGKIGIFYAQSWALVHYLMLGNETRRVPQFTNFLANLNSGTPVEENFVKSFGVSFEEMEKELRNYVGKFRFPVAEYTFTGGQLNVEKEMQSRPMPEAEKEFELGKLLFHLRELEEAEKRFTKSVALDANFAPARAWLGLVLTLRNNLPAAEEHLSQAVRLDANYYLAHVFQGDFFAARQKPDEAVAAYQRAVALSPNSPRNYVSLAYYLSVLGRNEEASRYYNRAIRLAPREARIFLSSSSVGLRMRSGMLAALQAQSYLRLQGWDEESSPYAALIAYFGWRIEKRAADMNRILKASLEKFDKTSWSYMIFRYLNREISAEELLKSADNQNKQTEARAYIGLDLSLDGKTEEALPYFKWVKENGNSSFLEYGYSVAELERIEKQAATPN
ncbi:MAG TPA: tetratricopeptide repeat protein [Pyrinomonadaceae bacterium]|nr:tetratricopeptide repeat protein [Pyrinomonadaceae bacterium]